MNWITHNASPLLNIVGIFFDIAGAVFVATEVVNKFTGQQFRGTFTFDESVQLPPVPTEEYQNWADAKERRMRIGLLLLAVGFILQILGNALQLRSA